MVDVCFISIDCKQSLSFPSMHEVKSFKSVQLSCKHRSHELREVQA